MLVDTSRYESRIADDDELQQRIAAELERRQQAGDISPDVDVNTTAAVAVTEPRRTDANADTPDADVVDGVVREILWANRLAVTRYLELETRKEDHRDRAKDAARDTGRWEDETSKKGTKTMNRGHANAE